MGAFPYTLYCLNHIKKRGHPGSLRSAGIRFPY
nr:MAG TPA: DNA binding protein [Caudoviricetes sp.]